MGIFLATTIGLIVRVARLSKNWLVNRLALGDVELFRDTPLLVQLFVYFVVFLQLPGVRDSITLPGSIYLSQRGLYTPRPELADSGAIWLAIVVVAIVIAGTIWFIAGRRDAVGLLSHTCAGWLPWRSSVCPSWPGS